MESDDRVYHWVQFDDDYGSPGHWVIAECYGDANDVGEYWYQTGFDWGRTPFAIGPRIMPPNL